MTEPLLLYSTATRLAYRIAQRYYKDVHHAWCSPVFDGRVSSWMGQTVPPSSSPCEIYWRLYEDVRRNDGHSEGIKSNRMGITRGAQAKQGAGVIDVATRDGIIATAELATAWEFRPLLFVMPFDQVRSLVTAVPVTERANEFSAECLIPLLPGRFFEAISLASYI